MYKLLKLSIIFLLIIILIVIFYLYINKSTILSKNDKNISSVENTKSTITSEINDNFKTNFLNAQLAVTNLMNYQGLCKNINQLAVGIGDGFCVDRYCLDKIYLGDIKKENYELDLYFEPFFNVVEKSSFFKTMTFKKMTSKDIYNKFELDQEYSNPANSYFTHYKIDFYFNNKINIKPISSYNKLVIGKNIYFYVIFEISNLIEKNIKLNYILRIIITLVKKENEKEIKKFENTIYILEEKNITKNTPFVSYTNRIIKFGETPFGEHNDDDDVYPSSIRYMLLYIND